MNIAVFTSNQPRHLALLEALAGVADTVYAIQETLTLFPGRVADFYRRSPVMQDYFGRVIEAERAVFGEARFLPANVRQLALRNDDLNMFEPRLLDQALAADVIVVLGASFIRDPLVSLLAERRAINIHMGVSPYYRGAGCNFWAMYDRRPDMVGATVHRLSSGLDSGDMLFHAFPPPGAYEPFEYGMLCVRAAQRAIARCIADGTLHGFVPVRQDRARELRYARNAEFTDAVAEEYLARLPARGEMEKALRSRDESLFLQPHYC